MTFSVVVCSMQIVQKPRNSLRHRYYTAMLTGRLVRVRYSRNRVVPCYLDVEDAGGRESAERLLDLFRGQQGRTRGELEEDLREIFGDDPAQLVHQGLAKLLEDRCEFEVVSGHPPEQLRELVFALATAWRKGRKQGVEVSETPAALSAPTLDRAAVLREVAGGLGMTPEAVEQGLFADL